MIIIINKMGKNMLGLLAMMLVLNLSFAEPAPAVIVEEEFTYSYWKTTLPNLGSALRVVVTCDAQTLDATLSLLDIKVISGSNFNYFEYKPNQSQNFFDINVAGWT